MNSIFDALWLGPSQAQCCGRCSCLNNVSLAEQQRQWIEHFRRTQVEHEKRQLEAQRWIDDAAGQIRRG